MNVHPAWSRRIAAYVLATTAVLKLVGCEGPAGPAGPAGPEGMLGMMGDPGKPGTVPCAGDTPGLAAKISVSAPRSGTAFSVGEQPEITLRLSDRCGNPLPAASLGTANLYLTGPRAALLTKTASKLLNCVTDRQAADRQHHFINLIAPKLADPSRGNLTADADGTLHFRLSAISDEPPGTYTLGLWAKSKDEVDQIFALQDLQIGSETVEPSSVGPPDAASCADCHQGALSGKMYMHHIEPGFSPLGNYALDQYPIATCKSCHNQDGYSVNPALRKIHGAHRGKRQLQAGVAHPDYGLGTDNTLKNFLNVGFPSMPEGEKDCQKCHRDDRWKTAPSRLACGTCHDNLFFDSGTLNPPRVLGRPTAGACMMKSDCAALGQLAECNTGTGLCENRSHPTATDDAQCSTCHTADSSGIAPIPTMHAILTRTAVRGLKVQNLTQSGGSGAGGVVQVGDVLTVSFGLQDSAGNPIADLKTNAALSGTVIVAGPTDDRQRIFSSTTVSKAALTYSAGTYSFALPAFPATAQPPLNTTGVTPRANGPGTYSIMLYVTENLTVGGRSVRDAGTALHDFKFGADQPIRPREVILRGACQTCHVDLQLHGGSRRDAQGCSLCHTVGALDRAVGARGTACTTSSQCAGFAAGWETCQDTNADMVADTCIMTADPTPNQTIAFKAMIHQIHYARHRGGYAESGNLVLPGKLAIIGFSNSVNDFSEVLLPQDVRNCTKCHADSGATCSSSAPCGIGQACVAGVCRNSAYKQPSTLVCLACHNSAAAKGHAALQTWIDGSGKPIETCEVCHGDGAEFAVSKVHNISTPYVPPYTRE